MRRLILAILLGGCGQILGLEEASLAPGADDDPLIDASAPDAYVCESPDIECTEGADLVCTSLDTDPDHCGDCETYCERTGGTATCIAGDCALTCAAGYRDCDADSPGCESIVATDEANCGGCGVDCLGATCSGGVCQPLTIASAVYYPELIAAGADHVYFTDKDRNAIYKLPKDGSAPPVSFKAGLVNVYRLEVGAGRVFWQADTTVYSVAEDGSDPITVLTGQPNLWESGWHVVDTALYWVTSAGAMMTGALDGTGAVRVGTATVHVRSTPWPQPQLMFAVRSAAPTTYLGCTSPSNRIELVSDATDMTQVRSIATEAESVGSYGHKVYTDATHAYFSFWRHIGTTGCSFNVRWGRVLKTGGTVEIMNPTTNATMVDIETVGGFHYVLESFDRLVRFPVGGGASTVAELYPSGVKGIATDGQFLYVTNSATGTIHRR